MGFKKARPNYAWFLTGRVIRRSEYGSTECSIFRVAKEVTVKEIMTRDLLTVTPETPMPEAMALMRRRKVGCLPVVENDRLVGIITAYDFLALSAEIIEKQFGD